MLTELASSTIATPGILLAVVFLYAVVVAAFLPFPSEAVLVVPFALAYPWYVSFPLVIVTSAAGKAAGSLIALRIGYGVSRSGPVVRFFERVPYYKQFKQQTLVGLVQRYSYLGLGIAIAIPFLPETTTIYAFSVLDNRPFVFAATTFLATIARLLLVLTVVGGAYSVVD
ncbi:VTT domain-containing protein [Halalkaliarchaeum sp. AArc-CO]|uniref:VTT domain-containing protein n=1 Tax=Halalkaliarchaeum sp. AArc-CO TaxID=2866381 RepID=UPI00217D51F3|nr:VTT domain-containing protein [Halalkaliarchaeum sp. AArc-CO]